MLIATNLRKWLVVNCGVKADATDDEFKKAAAAAMIGDELTAEKLLELTKSPEDDEADEFAKKFDAIADGIGKLTELLTAKEAAAGEGEEAGKKKAGEAAGKEAGTKAGEGEPSRMSKMVASLGGTPVEPEGKNIDVRVKEAAERYGTTKSAMTYPERTKSGMSHPLAGQPVKDFAENGRQIDNLSQRDLAVCGAYAKLACAAYQRGGSRTFGFQALPQHDKELLYYAMENMDWSGCGPDSTDPRYADICQRHLNGREQKALIDDATSGGFEAAPIVFDDQVIQAPLLHGELFPLINTIPLDRGRRIEGVATGTATGSWGGVDDSAISLFNTASYVSAFDTTIFRWEGSIRIGLDFLSDSPINFGQHVTQQYGERLLKDLDDVIAAGNGTDRPEGIINKSGTTSVAFGGATSLGNYESLRFGVGKQEHVASMKASTVFCGTETGYQRARALPVGTGDARRLGGMSYSDYSWMERPYKINASLSNNQIFYAILARYRMWRRRGLTIRTSTEGDTLMRRNELLMVATARYGGQLERGACAAVTTTAPA